MCNNNLLYFDFNPHQFCLAFYEYPIERVAIMKDDKEINFVAPTMVYFCKKNSLYVFCTDEVELFPDTKLYHIPLPNLGNNGLMCNGTVQLHIDDYSSLQSIMQGYSNMFWLSYFTDDSSDIEAALVDGEIQFDKLKVAGTLESISNKIYKKINDNQDYEEEDFDDE